MAEEVHDDGHEESFMEEVASPLMSDGHAEPTEVQVEEHEKQVMSAQSTLNSGKEENTGKDEKIGKDEKKEADPDKRACWNCATELSIKSKFCRECGKNQEHRGCRKCGHLSHPESKYCEECGESLAVPRFIMSPGSEKEEDQKGNSNCL